MKKGEENNPNNNNKKVHPQLLRQLLSVTEFGKEDVSLVERWVCQIRIQMLLLILKQLFMVWDSIPHLKSSS